MIDKVEEIWELIVKNQIETALEVLAQSCGEGRGLRDKIVVLRQRYNGLKSDYRDNLLTYEQYSVEKARFAESLIDFVDAIRPPVPAKTLHAYGSRAQVEFLIAAGCASEFAVSPARQACYSDDPGDWLPYYPPNQERIGPVVQLTAAAAKLTSRIVTVEDVAELIDWLEQAQNNQTIVILLVDPWSLRINKIESCLKRYDQLDFLIARLSSSGTTGIVKPSVNVPI